MFAQGHPSFTYYFSVRVISDKRLPNVVIDLSHAITEPPKGTYLLRVAKENYPLNGKYTINTVLHHILEVDQNGDTVDYWDLPKILDPYRDDVILAMDQGAVCLSVDAEHSGQVMTKEQLAKQPFGDIAGSGPGRNWAHVNSVSYDPRDD
ncbi:aryl-sulfate sulfotransferase, partial [Leptospira borgpetersenii serovar Hardjo-bovis]|nr:aryl-sulfate sulfotransferase [Leptospira borgpetersenii serovar Hardjo-bovis]